MRRLLFIVIALFLTSVSGLARPKTAAQRYVDSAVETPLLEKAVVAVLAVTEDGDTLAAYNPSRMLVPASNMKLVTTGLTLNALGPDYRFTTSLAYSGCIEGGVLKGDLYIVGGADPTLASPDTIATAISKTFAAWRNLLAKAGIKKIDGHIVGDGRWFDGCRDDATWQWEDLGTYYGTGASGLSFYENVHDLRATAGKDPGDPVGIVQMYPKLPWLNLTCPCTTGEKGTGDQLYLYVTDLAPYAQMRGTFAVDRKPKTLSCANKFPEYTCASYFANYLERTGIPCTDGPADLCSCFALADAAPSDSLHILGSTKSPELSEILNVTNRASNNFYAETLLRTLGRERRGSASYDSARVEASAALKALGVDASGIRMRDGSGLSKHDYVSPAFFCSFLREMMSTKHFDTFLESLPYPGGRGTLKGRMPNADEALKARVRMKSGSMDGVRCFSGYILPQTDEKTGAASGKTVIFSIMINNSTEKPAKLGAVTDAIIERLATN